MPDHKIKFDDGEVRHRYADNEVRCNFDLRKLLDEHHNRQKSGRRSTPAAERKRELRRLVGQEGMTLEEAEKHDFDAFADDMAVLEKLGRRFLMKPENAPMVGAGGTFRKGSILIEGASRSGKDVLAHETVRCLLDLASLAGLTWRVVKPGGRNALEDIGRAEVAHHEDVRFEFTPTFDETLRYLDPNEAVIAATRFSNSPPIAPRAILMTTSETVASLALTMKARKTAEELAKSADEFAAVNVDEFLFRLGWLVKVRNRDDLALHDLAGVKREMVVSISRVHRRQESRIDVVVNRDGDARLGSIRTRHEFELVAQVKGCERAARFLAHEILAQFSPDVAAMIPDAVQAFAPERQAIEAASQAILDQRAHGHEAAMTAAAEAEYGPAFAVHFAADHLAGTDTPDPVKTPFIADAWSGEFSSPCCIAAGAIQPATTPVAVRG